jgi:hypothetical protein
MWETRSFQYSEAFCFPSIGKPWVNAHSGFLSGALIMFITYVVELLLTLFGPAESRSSAKVRLLWWTQVGCVLFLVTLVNPYGGNLYVYLINTLTDSWITRGTTTEWGPPTSWRAAGGFWS